MSRHIYSNPLLATLAVAALATLASAAPLPSAVGLKAQPFALSDVRLLDGPFKSAMERDAKYMLELDPDRLLHNFRITAGLPSSAQPLGGWEDPKGELRGHAVGHYLSACALMYASTGDQRFKDRAALLVRELGKCQAALGNSGYLSAFPESFFDRLEARQRVWAPWYTLHKVFAGLLDAHTHCGDPLALEVATKFGDWVVARTSRLTDEHLQKTLDTEHGGINESMANLYGLTGNPKYLEAAKRLCHQRVLGPLADKQDKLAGLHANTQFPKLIGAARLYELTGESSYQTMASFFWDRVVNHHSYATGGNSEHEHFGPPDQLNARVSPDTTESCNTYNMLKLTRHVFAWEPSAAKADFIERALYNHILASQDPRTGMMAYFIPLHGGWFMPYNTPTDSFWCCTGTGFENHARYGETIYWRDEQGLLVNLFIPSELTWREKGITLRQQTRYPQEETTRIELRCDKPVEMSLRLRYPAWATRGIEVKVNGQPVPHNEKPGSYVAIARTWKTGDVVDVAIPMSLRLQPMPDNPNRAAICYGPVVLAGELGSEGMKPPMPYAKGQLDFFKVATPVMPGLITSGRPVEQWVEPVPGKPLTFRTKGVGEPADITLVAFYLLTPQRYSIYWDVYTPERWTAHQQELEKTAQRDRDLKARTIDHVRLGDFEPEAAHNLQGQSTSSGRFSNRAYRHATDGGWFSYDLKVPADKPAKLLVTYWGSDGGKRLFDVLVNGRKIATVKLDKQRPGEFFDMEHELSPTLIQGKSKVTVKFQAHPGCTAGGIFDLRVVKAP